MTLRDPRVTAASMAELHVCVDCARRLLDRGFERVIRGQKPDGKPIYPAIELGDECEAHPPPARVRPQATTVILAPATERTILETLVPGVALEDTPPEGLPALPAAADPMAWAGVRFGAQPAPSLTEIATRLVVEWSSEDRFADDAMIESAVQAARSIRQKTGGQ